MPVWPRPRAPGQVFLRIAFACLCAGATAATLSPALAEETIAFESRGQVFRGLLNRPEGAPRGSLILLAGSSGWLGIGQDGRIGDLGQNQLVRTRQRYTGFELATLTLDLAPDLTQVDDGDSDYAERYAADIAVAVRRMRAIAEPVVAVGTSRGSLRAAMALARNRGTDRPDAVVFTAAYLTPFGPLPAVQTIIGAPQSLPPTLIVHHRDDECPETPPEGVAPFRAWGGPIVRVIWLEGGEATGNPCQARSHHGFLGLDGVVVEVVSHWVRTLPRLGGTRP